MAVITVDLARNHLAATLRKVIDALDTMGLFQRRYPPAYRRTIWKAFDATARKWEPRFEKGAVKAFENDRREILAIVNRGQKESLALKATVNWKKIMQDIKEYLSGASQANWRKTFTPLVEGVVADQGEKWASRLGVQFDVQNLQARDWFNKYMLKFAQPVNETTSRNISEIMERAQAEGSSIPDIEEQLDALFGRYMDGATPADPDWQWFTDRAPVYRRELIARTETIRASNAGTHELFKEWGVKKHEWLSTQDDRTRTVADGAEFEHLLSWPDGPNGEVREIDEPFTGTGEPMLYPGDPSGSLANFIQCRCTLLPVIGEGEELQPEELAGEEGEGEHLTAFETRERADEWGSTQDGINPKLTKDEHTNLSDYKVNTYRYINEYLRTGESEDDWTPEILSIDGALQKTSLPESIIVYRGMDVQGLPDENQTGGIFEDKGYWSTSLAKETGEKFARWATENEGGKAGLIVIDAPKGIHGMWMQGLFDTDPTSSESELLLPRGTKAEIISDTIENETRVLRMRVIQ